MVAPLLLRRRGNDQGNDEQQSKTHVTTMHRSSGQRAWLAQRNHLWWSQKQTMPAAPAADGSPIVAQRTSET